MATNLACADHAVTTVRHASIPVRYILSFFSKEEDVASLIPRAYTPYYTSSSPC